MVATGKRWRTDGLDLGPNVRDMLPIDFPPPVPGERRGVSDSIVFNGAPPVVDEQELGDSEAGVAGADVASANESEAVRLFPTIDHLQIRPRDLEERGRQKSAGWLGSILLHLAILVFIAFLVAPADFGGFSTQTLVMRIDDAQQQIPSPMMLVQDVASEQDSSQQAEPIPEPVDVEPLDVSFQITRPAIRSRGTDANPGDSSGGSGGGASGSFFGIEAVGQDFVYVVDRSGSMNGVRYHRAISELKRSIGELRPDQRFFVILFSNSSTTMVGHWLQTPEMLQATQENKKMLDEWLATVRAGGGTYPNSSLRMALKMKPSAVFMLSDGEFSKHKMPKRGGLLSGKGDAFSIVAAVKDTIPIHAIAFEDPSSCANMKRLADMTGGEYRFVNSAGKTQSQLVAEARNLMNRTRSPLRTRDQDALVQQFASRQINADAKRTFAQLLVDDYEKVFGVIGANRKVENAAGVEKTTALLASVVAIDPDQVSCADLQNKVAEELSRLLERSNDKAELEQACDRLLRVSRSIAATNVLDQLVDHFESLDQGDPDQVFARLRLAKMTHPQSKVVAVYQAACDKITDEILDRANQFLEQDDLAAAIKTLRQSESGMTNANLRSITQSALRELTMEKLFAARDASLRHDTDVKDAINEQLAAGFENDPRLPQWRREIVARELHAKHLLQQAMSGNAHSRQATQRQQLESLVQQYPNTVATQKAKQQLKHLPKWEAARNQEESELIRMMDDTRRR